MKNTSAPSPTAPNREVMATKTKKAAVKKARSTRPASIERRHAPRRQPAIGTVCRFGANGMPTAEMPLGLVWNISESGVSVLVHDASEPGAELEGELTTMDARAALPIAFRVSHVKLLETGDYLVAGPFRKPISADAIHPFVNVPAPTAAKK
jgi:hypothetical protein